ncbi:hypothetical protein C2G38_2166410 [Gigaspora rosea]|uniref:Uncharacterized protein n=1 Tax=Gigaspora rosea TaxID=44941 RepID=A0A397VTZ4_9GLOM|nr:hypothetical protein C2G38_2166410 [Gigaspora rosea]
MEARHTSPIDDYNEKQLQAKVLSSLPSFSTEDVLMVTGKFRFIENIILHDIVHLHIDPSELPASPLLINMTAVAMELSRNDSDHDIISLSIEIKGFVDQKLDINLTNPVKIPWLKESNEPAADKSDMEKVARTIASRVKNTRIKKAPATRPLTSFANSPWIIFSEMQQIIDKFENEILCQFLCVPCSIC